MSSGPACSLRPDASADEGVQVLRYPYHLPWRGVMAGAVFFGGLVLLLQRLVQGAIGGFEIGWTITGVLATVPAAILVARRLCFTRTLVLDGGCILFPHGFLRPRIARIPYSEIVRIIEPRHVGCGSLALVTAQGQFEIGAAGLPDPRSFWIIRERIYLRALGKAPCPDERETSAGGRWKELPEPVLRWVEPESWPRYRAHVAALEPLWRRLGRTMWCFVCWFVVFVLPWLLLRFLDVPTASPAGHLGLSCCTAALFASLHWLAGARPVHATEISFRYRGVTQNHGKQIRDWSFGQFAGWAVVTRHFEGHALELLLVRAQRQVIAFALPGDEVLPRLKEMLREKNVVEMADLVPPWEIRAGNGPGSPRVSERVGGLGIAFVATLLLGSCVFAGQLTPVDGKRVPEVFVWSDTCNVYVVRDGDAALLVDLGDGSVLDRLADIGVRKVEWVLFTHHHREQCQGAPRLLGTGAKVAAPEAERALFERPTDFRKMEVSLGDAFTIHGSSYVRPPIQPIPLDRAFTTNDVFVWRGREFQCLSTPGNSPGGMTYRLRVGEHWLTFSGDVMLAGSKMHTWFDTEWDYGFAAGIQALRQSVARLESLDTAWLLPSHGGAVHRPAKQLRAYGRKLEQLERLYVRGYGVEGASAAYQDKVSRPTAVTNVVQVTPHLFKFKRANFWPNFGLILADNGHALVVDCGLLDEAFLDAALQGMREHFGLKAIDAVIITHMHGDHFLEAPHLRATWGAPIWALASMVDKMEHPEWFDYAAPIQAYGRQMPDGSRLRGVRVDRAFQPGERFEWEGHRFTVDWMPGQTEFALCLNGVIDGRRVAFTGDNIFGDPEDPTQTGHEAMVAHNSAILEEGYILGAEYLHRLKPDLLIGGHSFVMDHPGAFIERYRRWAYQMRDAFKALGSEKDYRYGFDPFWVRAEPYRVVVRAGGSVDVALHVRNFLRTRQAHRIEIHAPAGLAAEPAVMSGEIAAGGRRALPFRVNAEPGATLGVRIVALDVTLDGRRYGERFDVIVEVQPAASPRR